MKKEMSDAGYDVLLTCTHRSNEEQAQLYAQGRTAPGNIVTNAKPGKSRHNSLPAEAFDVAIKVNGKLDWNLGNPAWNLVGKIGERLGLEWGGSWQRFKEGCHFQLKS